MLLIPHPYIGALLFFVLRLIRISRRRHLNICGSVFVDAQLGFTALIFAARHGRADCARLLLDAGADKDATINVRGRFAAFADEKQCLWVLFRMVMMLVVIRSFTLWV
jgi:hypothetical protein